MAPPAQRPNAEELERLTQAFQRDPASTFVALGRAYLALGRPRDAVEVGSHGLRVSPRSVEGRLMMAGAFVMLHQWKEAQAELLRVVKADRENGAAFRTLGEVLMRRADYERALPVLQHAQNLLPADPGVLNLLRRARAGQPLDPPPPIPAPVAPGQNQEALGRMELRRQEVAPAGAVEAGVHQADSRGRDEFQPPPPQIYTPPAPEEAFAPLGASPAVPAGPPAGAAPPGATGAPGEGARPKRPSGAPPNVRPRVLSAQKPKDAAQASLRQSAAVGEKYLNNLLLGGLLEVPNVRAADVDYEVKADRRWGRSAGRMFIYLFVLLFVGISGAGTWYWYAEKQKAEDIARLLEQAKGLLHTGAVEDLEKGHEAAREALELDTSDPYAIAVYAENTGLSVLLYREIAVSEVERAIGLIEEDVSEPTDEGYRELLVARAAAILASAYQVESRDDAIARLTGIRDDLGAWLEKSPDDHLVRWLEGRALLMAGARKEAKAAFERAYSSGEGPLMAGIDLADMKLDQGEFEEALELYNEVLEKSPKHQLAFVGRSLARSERSIEAEEAMSDVNVGLADPHGPRVASYKYLALAITNYLLEDYPAFDDALEKASNLEEPRFLARKGLYRVRQGRFVEAAEIRTRIRWFGKDPDAHPLVKILDAEISWATGFPDEALEIIGEESGLRAAMVRGQAMFDLGRHEDALGEFEAALEIAPEDLWVNLWAEASRMLSAKRTDARQKADRALDKLGRGSESKAAKLPHGIALIATGRPRIARDKLEASLRDITEEYPNPLAYRSHVALAELDLAEENPEAALEHVQAALEQVGGYLPAEDLKCRLLAESQPDEARKSCARVVEEDKASAGAEIAWVKTIMPSESPEVREAALAAIKRAQAKKAPVEDLQAAVALFEDEALFEELEVPPPKE